LICSTYSTFMLQLYTALNNGNPDSADAILVGNGQRRSDLEIK